MALPNPQQIVNEVESYVSSRNIDTVVKDLVVSTLKNKPPSVEAHMLKCLMEGSSGFEGDTGVALASSQDGKTRVAVTHADEAAHKYLVSKGIHELLAELVDALAREQPEDVSEFLARQLRR